MKNLVKSAFLASMTLLALSACTVDKEKLLNDLVGNWKSKEPIDKEMYDVARQFYPSKDGESGNFIEDQTHYVDEEDPRHGIPFNLHYEIIVCGTYKLNDAGDLSLKYDTASLALIPDEDDMASYQRRVREWDAKQENPKYTNESSEKLNSYLQYLFEFDNYEVWQEIYADISDKDGEASIRNLKIEGDKLTYQSDEKSSKTWTKIENFFDEDFFDKEEEDAEGEDVK